MKAFLAGFLPTQSPRFFPRDGDDEDCEDDGHEDDYEHELEDDGDADYDDARLHEIQSYLNANIPEQGPARVVHGDYGLHNCLIGADAKIAAVLDWEISTLGDPLADLAYALNQWALPGDQLPVRENAPTALPGFPSRDELVKIYSSLTRRDLSDLKYYIAFNWCKSAMIIHGVYARYRSGKKSTEGVDMEDLRERIGLYLTLADDALRSVAA